MAKRGLGNTILSLVKGRTITEEDILAGQMPEDGMMALDDEEVIELSPEELALQEKREERKRKRVDLWYSQYKEAKDDRHGIERMWDWCIKALWGQQDLVRDPGKNKLRYDNRYITGKARYIFDKLTPIYRQMSSRLLVEYPSVSILPTAQTQDNIVKAIVNQEICRFYWFSTELKDVIMEAIETCIVTGAAGFHTYYDPSDEIVKSKALTPFDIFWPKNVKRWEDSPWWAVRSVIHRDELIDMYPESITKIEEAHEIDDNEYPPDHVEVFDVYWRDGLHCIMLEQTKLWEGSYNPKALPVQYFRYTNITNIVFGVGLIEKLLPYQLIYNRKRNRIIQTLDKMGNPKILVPTQCQVSDQMLEGDSSLVVRYNPMTGKPEYMTGVTLPSDIYGDLNRIDVEIEDVAGLHATSLGKVARGVRSARHVEALSSKDDTQLFMTQANTEKAVGRLFKAALVTMKEYYSEDQEKTLRMFDDKHGFIMKVFNATDLIDMPEVSIESGTLFRSETQDREARAIDKLAAGMITPEQANQIVDQKTADEAALDKAQAMSHAQQMLADLIESAGQGMVEIYPTDDLETFEEIFRKFMQSSAYRDLALLPEGQAVQDAIATTYKQLIGMLMPQQQMSAAPGPGQAQGGPQQGAQGPEGMMGGGSMDLPPQGVEEGIAPAPIPNMGMVG